MFLSAHSKIALDLLKDQNLNQKEKNLLIAGSSIPDISEFNLASGKQTHTKGLELLKEFSKEYKYFSIGIILHGEKPKGLDHYAHKGFYNYKTNKHKINNQNLGYVGKKYKQIKPIAEEYKTSLGTKNVKHAIHHLIEISFDHLILKNNPSLTKEIITAFNDPISEKAAIAFANHFQIERKDLQKIREIIDSDETDKFINNLNTIEGLAENYQKYIFLSNVNKKNNFLKNVTNLIGSSYNMIKSKINTQDLEEFIERTTEIVREDYQEFTQKTKKELRELIKEHNLLEK